MVEREFVHEFWDFGLPRPDLFRSRQLMLNSNLNNLSHFDRFVSASGDNFIWLIGFAEKGHAVNISVMGRINDIRRQDTAVLFGLRIIRIRASSRSSSSRSVVFCVDIRWTAFVLGIAVEKLVCLSGNA